VTFNESLRDLCDSVFLKSAQGRLLGLWFFFETQRGTEPQREERGGRVREVGRLIILLQLVS